MKNKHAQALGKLGGKKKSPKKSAASRENGKKGGRRKKTPDKMKYMEADAMLAARERKPEGEK